ncbi:MAG: signal peptidase II [Candidatus Thioglobus sp.]|nr:MAG: signal peptidase II [Candidatus Thioglobus sp.]
MKIRNYYWLTIGLILLDQLSKIFVANSIEFGAIIVVNDFFSWHHLRNYGAAFSFLAEQDGWQRYFFATISLLVSGWLLIWMHKTKPSEKYKLLALSLILAGAIGNLIDRIAYGFVIDFIDLHYQNFYWPVFNGADIFISIGIFLLIIVDWKKI